MAMASARTAPNDSSSAGCQIDAAEQGCFSAVTSRLLPGVGHSPFREAAAATIAAITAFAAPLLDGDIPVRSNRERRPE